MLITFKSRAHADVTMFGDVALELIRLMGRRDTVPSAMYPEDIPDALDKLRSGLVLQEAAESVVVTNDEDEDEEEQIGIQTRAMPLTDGRRGKRAGFRNVGRRCAVSKWLTHSSSNENIFKSCTAIWPDLPWHRAPRFEAILPRFSSGFFGDGSVLSSCYKCISACADHCGSYQ